ncbi:tetrahydrofolate dehydrogenase/cyclohydrolase catalytic domain-containing protein, partial [Oleiphilus sp. HI0066]|uniref:tetrahydrofolate dehydrogenase/cyclohydrolase catalytic domain-containing protein n=2 Tax=Oleiphilus TaxID=141450 RepID=UPI000AACACC5
MSAQIIDGKAVATQLKEEIAKQVAERIEQGKRRPGLAVILVGDDPASEVYVRNKNNACEQVGFKSEAIVLPESTQQHELEALIDKYNNDPEIDGILVQLPLPDHLDSDNLLEQIKPDKDVDGFHPFNIGRLAQRMPLLRPCTPKGVITLLEKTGQTIRGK